MPTAERTVEVPIEFKRLFDSDWREAAVYGGRYCFSGATIISMADGGYRRINSLSVGDKVLSLVGDQDIITDVSRFRADYDPKPMLLLDINGTITRTTYDHKYFDGHAYVPIYQLVWGIMAPSQRRELELLCKQYGPSTDYELQGWLQDGSDETGEKPFGLLDNRHKRQNEIGASGVSKDFHIEPREQSNREPQERQQDGQPSIKFGVGYQERAIPTLVGHWTPKGSTPTGDELPSNHGSRSTQIVEVSLRSPNHADTDDGGDSSGPEWARLQWDTGFAQWKNLEASTVGVSTPETEAVGSSTLRIAVDAVCPSEEVWCIETAEGHNYFANGVNVSNSLKSHTVARVLLMRARSGKVRVACFREFQNSIAESSHQLLADLISRYGLNDFKVTDNAIVNTVTGSDFIFKGLRHNEQSVKSIEGIDIAWVEEAQTISEHSLEVLTPTIRKPGSQIIYTYNRLLDDDPVHKRLVMEGRPNTLIINVNYDVALRRGWMPDVIRLEMEDDKARRPSLYKYKWLGEPNTSEGRIYTGWQIIDEIPHEARLERYGLDFGYTNDPTAVIAVYSYNGGYIWDEVLYRKGMSNKQIADHMMILPEALTIADSAEPKSIDELISFGVRVLPCTKGPGSVSRGIAHVQAQKISVTRRSTNTIKEYNSYLWLMDKAGKPTNDPEPGMDHSMDAGRYAMESLNPDKRKAKAFHDPRYRQR